MKVYAERKVVQICGHSKTDNVIKSDYLLSLPGIVEGILAGDLIDVTDRQGTFTSMYGY
jgi:hypothetical protein